MGWCAEGKLRRTTHVWAECRKGGDKRRGDWNVVDSYTIMLKRAVKAADAASHVTGGRK